MIRKINLTNIFVLVMVGVACFWIGVYAVKRAYDPVFEKVSMYMTVYRDIATVLYKTNLSPNLSWSESQHRIDNAAYQAYGVLKRSKGRYKNEKE